MSIENKEDLAAWFSPKRIMKLYNGKKADFGSRRVFVIGIGENGVDCVVRCKDIAENRYTDDPARVRFLGIGLRETLDSAEYEGSVLNEKERFVIDPDEAIYPYLNDPEKLPAHAKEWFDSGLRNYTPNKPAYGLTKRQCARAALFHYFEDIMKLFGGAINDFSGGRLPLEIIFTGNLGDAFFGGMFIDLANIARAMFTAVNYSVTVNAYLFAADTALLQGLDGRDLALFYANTAVTKSELDKFMCKGREYVQTFSDSYTFRNDKPPFSSCTINAAEDTYEHTIENIALKIMTSCSMLFKQSDDAERLLSYNMLGDKNEKHSFRYIACGVFVDEVPLGKITSYLTLKLIAKLNQTLMGNSVGMMELGMIASRVTPDDMFLASKAGDIPKAEFDESLNPLFSVKSLKNGMEASKKYVLERVEQTAQLCEKGAEIYMDEIYSSVRERCEQARTDNEKGPYYAAEIIRKCVSELKNAIKKTKESADNIEDEAAREEKLLQGEYRSLKGAFGLFGKKSAADYIARIKQYADAERKKLTGKTMLGFYEKLCDKFTEYGKELSLTTGVLSKAVDFLNHITDSFKAEQDGYTQDAFDISAPESVEVLNKMAQAVPETTLATAFKRSKLLKTDGSPKNIAREAVELTKICFDALLAGGYDDFCRLFGIEKNVTKAIEGCLDSVCTNTPTEEGAPLLRAICPRGVSQGEIAGLKAAHNSLSFIWNDSAMLHTVVVQQVCGGVKLDGFKEYEKWENMRYAYVNDSLKKHGIRIFN